MPDANAAHTHAHTIKPGHRRSFLVAGGSWAMACLGGCATPVTGDTLNTQACAPFDKARQSAVTPDRALAMLREGNERFVDGKTINCDLMAQVRATATSQSPFAAIVGCIDSRVPPELVFDQQIGDIFAARIAGNFVNTDIIGSLEFATELAGAKLIVVLGHTECGAVKGAVDDARLGHLTAMLANIRPAVGKVRVDGPQSSANKRLVQAVADQNAKDAAAMLLARSDVLRQRVERGQLKIVAAMHDIATGRISWFA
ncbi:carbonic anhydrase family protein [Caenimonas sp. SL110]|uniref:carbonic anhydrase family protein n=1 Tax=Caenimonas sp. SL110 TaxID=1450524 RepID=UPI0009E50836|nr:carbonic anhydrase family protein [Caenimonas sp. SL110]